MISLYLKIRPFLDFKKVKSLLIIFLFHISTINIFSQTDTSKLQYPNYWDREREYEYAGLYIDSTGEILTSERITLHPTGQIWEADPKQTLMEYKLDSITARWNKLPETPLNGIPLNWVTTFEEGVLQTSNKIWMHPIRRNQYILTELAPFPEIYFPVKKDTTWKSTLWIYKAFGSFEGTVECTYTILEEELRAYNFGKLTCWKVAAIGKHDKLGTNSAIYYFNVDYGFTEMNYSFYNNQKIEFRLTKLNK